MDSEILSYIPQRRPFVMISELISANEQLANTRLIIGQENIFVNDGYFTEPGLIENMAQTAGAGAGYSARIAKQAQPNGYIAALKNVNINTLPKAGDTIETRVVFVQNLLSFHLARASVMLNNIEIASCELKIFVHTDQSAS